ncbi:ATP-binding protein [Paucisalibacillus sp. EB02]|uniref:ATP-binding protein n=1 Tax=Paucisalibacillus sp. EB02 TaxID=1347087 RepID=UPI00069428AB|nr:ATP-binding protein [Paucisalibacillus sp. EB02]
MEKQKTLIQYTNEASKELKTYYGYAYPLNKIVELLNENYGRDFKLYNMERERLSDCRDVIEDILIYNPDEIELVTRIYDSIGSSKILSSKEGNYSISPSTFNNLFYFPNYEVALVSLPIYSYGHPYPENFLFGKSDKLVTKFLHFYDDIERKFMLQGITVFTDTEEGLVRSKEKITQQINREDVLLEDRLKTEIFRSIDEFFLHSGSFFKTYDIPYKRGILLYGSPGNGKTTLVKSIAGSVSAPIVYWQITEFTTSYSIHEIFSKVVRLSPMVLVIEDIDSMPEHSRSVFLNTLDGATTKEGIFLIGTTNYPEKIDPALINRAGRFDRAYEIRQPNEQLRKDYLVGKGITQFLEESKLNDLVRMTNGLSIAQLNEVYMSIALEWHYEKQVDIQKVIHDMQANQKKVYKQDWITDPVGGKLGF